MDRKFEQRGIVAEYLGGIPEDILIDPKKYEDRLPFIGETVTFLDRYGRAKNPRQREGLVEQLAGSTLTDLPRLGYHLENLNLSFQLKPDINLAEIQGNLIRKLEDTASRSSLERWPADRIEQLTQLSLDSSGLFAAALQAIKKGLFNGPDTLKKAVGLYYNAAWAMTVTQDATVREEIFSILCLEKSWFPPQSFSALCFNMSGMAPDDETLIRYDAVMCALRIVGTLIEGPGDELRPKLQSERAEARSIRIVDAVPGKTSNITNQKIQRLIREIFAKNPERFRRLLAAHSKGDVASAVISSEEGNNYLERADNFQKKIEGIREGNLYDQIVTANRAPLKDLVDELAAPKLMHNIREHTLVQFLNYGSELLTPTVINLPDDLELQVVSLPCQSPEERAAIVKEVYETIITGIQVNPSRQLSASMKEVLAVARSYAKASGGLWDRFDEEGKIMFSIFDAISGDKLGRLGSVLQHYRPLITIAQARELSRSLVKTREDIRLGFRRSIGKRGYQVMISDSLLRQLGYHSLLFQQPQDDEISVRLNLAQQEYQLILNDHFRVKTEKDILQFANLQDQMWLELVILSHLKKLMCTEEEKIEKELLSPEKQSVLYRKQVVDRREHLRKLPLGQVYSQEAFLRCLEGSLPNRNLESINNERGANKEDGQWTYVSPVEKADTQIAKPVRIAFQDASEDLRRVIPLGQISPEEIARIEKEILGELENL